MIYVYFPREGYGSGYATSDKSLKEVPSAFSGLKSSHLQRVEWETMGIYHSFHIPYLDREDIKGYFKNHGITATIVEEHEFNKICKAFNASIVPTNESVIREAVHEYLEKKHSVAYIQNEFTHTALPVRADLFAVTNDKKVITVEIKSDRDTFTRLRKQLEEYTKFSHIVYVAIDIAHLIKFKKGFPSYHGGILVYEDGELKLHTAPSTRKSIECSHLLWKQEYQQFLCFKGSFSKYSIDKLTHLIESVFTVREHRAISEFLFINRYLRRENDFSHLFDDPEYKQELIDKLIKRKVK
jgi:hypothetical protein